MGLQQRETGGAVTGHVIISPPMCLHFRIKQRLDQKLYEFPPWDVLFQVYGVVEATLVKQTECGVLEPYECRFVRLKGEPEGELPESLR